MVPSYIALDHAHKRGPSNHSPKGTGKVAIIFFGLTLLGLALLMWVYQ